MNNILNLKWKQKLFSYFAKEKEVVDDFESLYKCVGGRDYSFNAMIEEVKTIWKG